MFRDLLGLHDVWKGYAGRLVSQCGSNERLVQQRILAADLQVPCLRDGNPPVLLGLQAREWFFKRDWDCLAFILWCICPPGRRIL